MSEAPKRQAEQQQQQALTRPPPCPGCRRTMLLVGRETIPENTGVELLTFECECGQITVASTNN